MVELDRELPECSQGVDEMGADEYWLPTLGDDFIEDDDLDLVEGLVEGLHEFNSDSEPEKPDESPNPPKSPHPQAATPQQMHVQFKPPEMAMSPRQSPHQAPQPPPPPPGRAVFSGSSPGQLIYNPIGQTMLQVAPQPSPTSPHLSPQIVRQVVGGAQGDQFQGGFMSPRRSQPVPPSHNRMHVVQQIKRMNDWNDSRKGDKTPAPPLPPPSSTGNQQQAAGASNSEGAQTVPQSSNAAKNMDKWRNDEALGDKATISPVLYANKMHPNLKIDHPDWSSRQKQIQRLWRRISQEDRAPFLTQARENRHKQKALNSAKNQGRPRVSSSSSVEKVKKETPVQLPVPGAVPGQMAPVATVVQAVGQAPPTPPLHQLIHQQPNPQQAPQQSPSQPQIVATAVESPKEDNWKQFVVDSSPKPAASPSNGVSPSSSNTCPSPSASSALIGTDPFINPGEGRQRHASHDYVPNSPLGILSPHSPMPPPMSPLPDQFASPPPPRTTQPTQVHPQQPVVRFHHNGTTPPQQQQVQLQVAIQSQQQQQQQQQQFDRVLHDMQQRPPQQQQQVHQQQIRHVNQQGQQLIHQPVQLAAVDQQMLKNMERKERMRQIEQQRGTAPWQASGQIIMNHAPFPGNGQNGQQPVARFINQQGQYTTYPHNVRFVQNAPVRMMRPQIHHFNPQQQFQPMHQQQQQQQMMLPQQQAQVQHYVAQTPPPQQQQQQQQSSSETNNPDSFLASPVAKSPVSGGFADQFINDVEPKEDEKQITINGKIQIEPVGAGNAYPGAGIGINIAPKMNSNFSNNQEKDKEADEEPKEEVKSLKETATAQPIPQLDGHFFDSDDSDEEIPQFDGADDEKQAPSSPLVVLPKGKNSPQKHTQLKLVLGDKGKKAKDFRFGTSQQGQLPPRNISPKPKENSPKSGTIVATAKVTKPASPSSHGSPQQRPQRMMSPGSLRNIATSPSRSLSPGSSGGTPTRVGNTSNSSNRNSDARIRVQVSTPRQLGNIKLQMVNPVGNLRVVGNKDKTPANKEQSRQQAAAADSRTTAPNRRHDRGGARVEK